MVTNELLLMDNDCEEFGEGVVSLVDGFFNPEVIRENNIAPILKGLSMQVQQEVDVYIIDNFSTFILSHFQYLCALEASILLILVIFQVQRILFFIKIALKSRY